MAGLRKLSVNLMNILMLKFNLSIEQVNGWNKENDFEKIIVEYQIDDDVMLKVLLMNDNFHIL